jgi:RNA polymerase sigma factor (sigma-70 family)
LEQHKADSSAGSRALGQERIDNAFSKGDDNNDLVNAPFIVDYEARGITRFGRPCLVPLKHKPRPLTPKEFAAAALLIEHAGQYVSIETLCSRLQTDPDGLKPTLSFVRRALGLGSSQNLRDSSLILMPDGSPIRGYGIFVVARHRYDYTPNSALRSTRDGLLSDLGAEATLIEKPPASDRLIVRLAGRTVRIHLRAINQAAEDQPQAPIEPLSESEPAADAQDVLISWDRSRGVYGIKCPRQSTYFSHALLGEAQAVGMAYSLESSADIANNVFTAQSTFAARPERLAEALRKHLEHERAQGGGIPSNVTSHQDAQAIIVERLGTVGHGLLGVNPLPIDDCAAPLPDRILLYAYRMAPYGTRRYLWIHPVLAGHSQGLATSFHQREAMATLVLGLYEHDGTTLVAAWDCDIPPVRKNIQLMVSEATLRLAKQKDGVVSQPRQNLSMGRSDEVLVAPLAHLDRLISARLRPHPRQRMIDALGGDERVREHLNAHVWTMVIDGRLFQIQWCGPLLRGEAPYTRPFSTAHRFVAPAPNAVMLYAGHDPQNDVVVLWRHVPGEHMYGGKVFSLPESVVEAARTGMVTYGTYTGSRQLTLRQAVATPYETDALTSALRYLSRERARTQVWRSRDTGIHQELSEYLQPLEWPDPAQTPVHPWSITVDLPTLGQQSLDVFAYRAQVSDTPRGLCAITIAPFIGTVEARASLFTAGREPVLLGEWNGIYILFDPRARPSIKYSQPIWITASREDLDTARTEGLASMVRPLEHGEFEETIIFATGARLVEALDMRLRTLPTVNVESIRERLATSAPQAAIEMAGRLQRAMRLPERDTLTGTRQLPAEMIVTGPPDHIGIVGVEAEIRQALQTGRAATHRHLLRLSSKDARRVVLLHAGLRAVLENGAAPRWLEPKRFDVLWTLLEAAWANGTVADDLVQTACRDSLQWLFIGKRAPFVLCRHSQPRSYEVRLREADIGTDRSIALPHNMLEPVLRHASLYARPKARSDLVWAFIKNVGPAHIVPSESEDNVVLELHGKRFWVYGVTQVLHRSEDNRTDYVIPVLSQTQLRKMRSHPEDHHVIAAFDPARGTHTWVFWSAHPHVDRLHEPGYRLSVSADLPRYATGELRELDENREERVVIYDASHGLTIAERLKRLTADLVQDRLAALEAQASRHGLTLEQVICAMKPIDQMTMVMRCGLAPYGRRYTAAEIKNSMGFIPELRSGAFEQAIDRARHYLAEGEPLAELAEIVSLLRDANAEHYMGSRILLTMLRDLYGLESDMKPAPFAQVFGNRGFEARSFHNLYRELVMRLIRGANESGRPTTAHFRIDTLYVADDEASPTTSRSTQPDAQQHPMPGDEAGVARDRIAALIALPERKQLDDDYARAAARFEEEHSVAWPRDVHLPVALRRLPPDIELVMRAHLGVWPYPRPYTAKQLRIEFNIGSRASAESLIRLASEELVAHAHSASGLSLPVASERPTLERLATLLIERAELLSDEELNAVLARHGLATVAPIVAETTRQGVLGEFRPSLPYRVAIEKLMRGGMRTIDGADRAYWQPEQIVEIYKRIDAGEYARLLLLLRDPATRDETFADMVLRSVAAADRRASHRSSAIRGARMNTMEERETSRNYDTAVTRNLGLDPRIDTFLQRENERNAMLDRARAITDDEAQSLQQIAHDGQRAYAEFLWANFRLTYSATARAGYLDDRWAGGEMLADGIAGLQRAIWGYDSRLGSFGHYAFSVIRSTVLRRSAARYAPRFDVSIARAQEIFMTRTARAQLRELAMTRELRREPTLEELARAVLAPLLRKRLVARLKAEPSATQLQAGWRKYMPEFVRRMQENVELLDTYERVARSTSFDRGYSLRDGDEASLYDVVASAQPVVSGLPGEGPDTEALQQAISAALEQAGLTAHEQFVLRHRFGTPRDTELPAQAMAEHLGVDVGSVAQIFAAAAEKIRQSPEALALLMPHLRSDTPTIQ